MIDSVPATRPEVTTTGIYGEKLRQLCRLLLHTDLSWCGDLTARTAVLIVGHDGPPVGSRKLASARRHHLPCVTPAWVTCGACSLDATDAFDVCHELSGKVVCATGLGDELGRVQSVCANRGAKYSSLFTPQCELLVTSTTLLAHTSSSASCSAITTNNKIRSARKHGIWIITAEEFFLRYDATSLLRRSAPSSSCDASAEVGRSTSAAAEQDECPPSSPQGSRGLSSGSGQTCNDRLAEMQRSIKRDRAGCTDQSSGVSARSVTVSSPLRRTSFSSLRSATSTPRPSAVTPSAPESYHLATPHFLELSSSWRGSAVGALSAVVPPSLASRLTAIAATGTSVAPSQVPPRSLADEFSDVVAFCTPPHCLTAEQHDLLSSIGVSVTPQLAPFTTHVLVLSDAAAEECLFLRPGLQVVSWQWITRSLLEQRRLSCASFRVHVPFCPVVTFTGLSVSDKHELAAALQRSGLPCEVQDALVLGAPRASRAHSSDTRSSSSPSSAPTPRLFVTRNTTHLICPRRQLLSLPKVAMLAQHCHQHARRPSCSFSSSSACCRLVDTEWVCKSIQQGQWLDPQDFTLTIPHPGAFALHAPAGGGAAPPLRQRPSSPSSSPISVRLGALSPEQEACVSQASPLALSPPPPPSFHGSNHSVPRREEGKGEKEVVMMAVKAEEEEEEEEEEGAALSQPANAMAHDADALSRNTPQSVSSLPSVPPSSAVHRGDDEDEEAGGESPAATAARRAAVQLLSTSQPLPPSPRASQAETRPPAASSSPPPSDRRSSGERVPQSSNDPAPPSSHPYLATQLSPAFEHLLAELEAHPTSMLGGDLPFAVLGAGPIQLPAAVTVPLERQGGDASPRALNGESVRDTPPPLNVLQRASLHRQRLLDRQHQQRRQRQPQQQGSLSANRNTSDESQVVFYQMGLHDHDDVAVASLPTASQRLPQPCATTPAAALVHASTTTGGGVAATTPSASEARNERVESPAVAYTRSTASFAVFHVTRDVLESTEHDYGALVASIPRFRQTKKTEECTHFVTSRPSKTEPFLCCLAAGRWILTPAYLLACAAAGYIVKEDDFEWSAEVAAAMGCRSSTGILVRGCRVQRMATELPFARWRVRVCCTSETRAASFLHVLRSGGCTSLRAVTTEEVLAAVTADGGSVQVDSEDVIAEEKDILMADDAVFSEEELELYAQCASSRGLSPILRLDYLVQWLCVPGTPPLEMDLLRCVRAHKRSRIESSSTH